MKQVDETLSQVDEDLAAIDKLSPPEELHAAHQHFLRISSNVRQFIPVFLEFMHAFRNDNRGDPIQRDLGQRFMSLLSTIMEDWDQYVTELVATGAVRLVTATPPSPTATPLVTATPILPMPVVVLDEVLRQVRTCWDDGRGGTECDCQGVQASDDTYRIDCTYTEDSVNHVVMTRFDSEAAAHAQFLVERGDTPSTCFHGYDGYATAGRHPNNEQIVQETQSCQSGEWVVLAKAQYDWARPHGSAQAFAEVVYQSAVVHGLFPANTCPITP